MNELVEKIDKEIRIIKKNGEELANECEELHRHIQCRLNPALDRAIVAEENKEITKAQLKDRIAMIEFECYIEWLISSLPQRYALQKMENRLSQLAEERAKLYFE